MVNDKGFKILTSMDVEQYWSILSRNSLLLRLKAQIFSSRQNLSTHIRVSNADIGYLDRFKMIDSLFQLVLLKTVELQL